MTTEQNTQTAKAPYRVEVTTRTPNPKYLRGSFAARTRYPDIESKTVTYFETEQAAREFQAANGGFVGKLSPSGKSYQPVR